MRQRKVGTTDKPVVFLMVDSTDHVTGKTGLAPTVTLSKSGGGFGAAAGAVSEIASGWYALAGNATDRDTQGDLAIHATAAGADPWDGLVEIVAHDPFADTASILTDTAEIGVAGAGLTALGDTRLANLNATITSREASGAAAAAVGTLNDLAPQDVRDALKLAPTAGAPASGSTDADLDTLTTGVNVTSIGGQAASAAAPVAFPASVGTSTYAGADTAGTTTLLTRLSAARAGYLDNLSAGAVATAAKLLAYVKSLARKDLAADADLAGTYDATTDSLEALRDRGDSGAWGTTSGGGAVTYTHTVTGGGLPLDGCEVWVTTDEAGDNVVASGSTDALGQVVFMLDAGAYYVWKQLAGWTFTNPESVTVG